MRKLRALWFRLLALFSRGGDAEFSAELECHLAMHTEDGIRAGLSKQEARRQALIRLGGAEQAHQAYRERATLPWLEILLLDVRYGLRGFRRSPAFAVAVIATLALGIGATTAVFSVVDRILFRSLPYAHDDRLVSVGLVQPLEKQEFTLGGFFYEWRDNQKPFETLTFERGVNACNLTEANPLHLSCAQVAQSFLPTLGISPILGRNFLPEEDLPNGPKVAMISYGLWLGRYNRDPGVLGKTLMIDDHAVRIVGVLPKDFEMPRLQSADIVIPAAMDVAAQRTVNAGIGYPMWAFARLKPGVTVQEAQAEMEPLFKHTQLWIPAEIRQEFRLLVRPIRDRQMQEAYRAAWILLGAVIAVLLIACANVASLFSARGAARERELAVRSALGASRGRLIRQTLTEAVLLALAGGAAGCILAKSLVWIFVAIAPTGVPFLAAAQIDLRIAFFSLVLSLVCAALFGILPALEKPRATALAARSSTSAAPARLRRLLVALQIATSMILLSGASLLVRSFWSLEQQNLGMQTRNVLTVQVPLNQSRYSTGQAYMDFDLRAEAALRRIPGITAVGMSDSLPPDGWHRALRYPDIFVAGKPRIPAGTGGSVAWRFVTPGYFRILQIPVVEGRAFTEDDRNASGDFIILSKLLASRLFPQGKAIGQHIQFADFRPYFALDGPVFTVVGVAGNVKNAGLTGQDDPEYYRLRSNHHPESWDGHCFILLETSLPPSVVASWVRTQIAQVDPTAPVEIDTLSQSVSKLADRPRFEAALLGFFALTGLVMAVIGLYGVIAFMTTQRIAEIGVRMALGAGRLDILRLILRDGLRLILIGGAVGLVTALCLSRVLKSLLFSIEPDDPASFICVALLLSVVALTATLIPACSATKVDPMSALRSE